MSTVLTERTLFYYDLRFNPFKKFEGVHDHYIHCLKAIKKFLDDKDDIRIQRRKGTRIFLKDLIIEDDFIKGKLYKVRDDIFPEVYDFSDEKIRDFEIGDERGLVEATHFVIAKKSSTEAQIIVEYNHYGARTSDIIWYLSKLAKETKIIKGIIPLPIVRDDLDSLKSKIAGIKDFIIRVKKDNISRVNDEDAGLATSLAHAQEYSESELVEIKMTFKYKEVELDESPARKNLFGWLDRFKSKPTTKELFESFQINAENSENDDQMEAFNLLLDKERSVLSVDKKKRSRIIISDSFYPQIVKEYKNKFRNDEISEN